MVDVVSVIWDFGDGNISNEFIFFYVYVVGGVYMVILMIIMENGCESIYSGIINFESNDFMVSLLFWIVFNIEEEEKLMFKMILDCLMFNLVWDELNVVVIFV